ncbi:lipase family protein [Cerasibacillus sp. JNUCC 74]
MSKVSDIEVAEISRQSYENGFKKIPVEFRQKTTFWKNIETIKSPDTGLDGYVLQNPDTNAIVISFRGTESSKDIEEDIQGIILGDSDYTKKEYGKTPYLGTPSQDAALTTGKAKLNSKDKTLTYTNKNQFTEAAPIVEKYVKKHGANNIVFTGHSLGGGLAQYFAVKHDSNAVTFAAADVFDLLSKEDQKRALNGEFKDNIISYTYPNDIVGTFYNQSIGSVYYVGNPADKNGKTLKTHGIKNYLSEGMFNEEGYLLPHLLYGEKIRGQLLSSPLELKNSGVHDFHVRIQTELMHQLAMEMQESEELVATTRRALTRLLDDHIATMKELKNTYRNMVGSGKYDKLNTAHVDEIFRELVDVESDGTPLLIDINEFEHLLEKLRKSQNDTGEIAYNMEKMSKDFKHMDQILAQWLQIRQ